MYSKVIASYIGVRDHFRSGRGAGGGHNNFCPNFLSLPEKSNMFGQCIFVAHAIGGGGGGCLEEENTILFLSDCV